MPYIKAVAIEGRPSYDPKDMFKLYIYGYKNSIRSSRKLEKARERLAKYEDYQKLMEEVGASQLSITDADAKLMKSKNGFVVAYNPQWLISRMNLMAR